MRNIYRIAIVEDEAVWSNALIKMLRTYEQARQVTLQETLFTSIEDFLAGYKERYDLVFMGY